MLVVSLSVLLEVNFPVCDAFFLLNLCSDINSDRFPDVIIGCPYMNDYAGASYIITGSRYPQNVVLSSIVSSEGYAINGAYSYDFSGYAVAGSADMSGNGIALIVAPQANSQFGTAYLIITSTDGSFPNNRTVAPSPLPTSQPTSQPTAAPSPHPTFPPTMLPSPAPTKAPTPPPFWEENGPLIGGILGPALLGFIPIFFSKQICYHALEHWGSLVEEAKQTRRNVFQKTIYKGCKSIYIAEWVKDKQAREDKAKRDAKLATELKENNDIEMSRIQDNNAGAGGDHGALPMASAGSPSGSRDRSFSKGLFSFKRTSSNVASPTVGTASSGSVTPTPIANEPTTTVENPLAKQAGASATNVVLAVYRIEYTNPMLNLLSISGDHAKLLNLPYITDDNSGSSSAKLESKSLLLSSSRPQDFSSTESTALSTYTSAFLFCRQLIEYAPVLHYYVNVALPNGNTFNETLPNNWLVTLHLVAGHATAMSLPQEVMLNGLLLSTAGSVAFAMRLYSSSVVKYLLKSNDDQLEQSSTVSGWDMARCSLVVLYHATPLLVYSAVKQYVQVPFTAFDGLNAMLSVSVALQQCDSVMGSRFVTATVSDSVQSVMGWKEAVPVVLDLLAVLYFGHNLLISVPQLLSVQTASGLLTLLGNVATVHHVSKTLVHYGSALFVPASVDARFPAF